MPGDGSLQLKSFQEVNFVFELEVLQVLHKLQLVKQRDQPALGLLRGDVFHRKQVAPRAVAALKEGKDLFDHLFVAESQGGLCNGASTEVKLHVLLKGLLVGGHLASVLHAPRAEEVAQQQVLGNGVGHSLPLRRHFEFVLLVLS